MSVEKIAQRVSAADRPTLLRLLDEYLGELHREVGKPAHQPGSYPYLDAYFTEPGRHAFLLRADGEPAGFALVREGQSTGGAIQMAEFYVHPSQRRNGLGRAAASAIFTQFPGNWDLQVHARNERGVAFWSSCARALAQGPVRETALNADDGPRIQLEFSIA